MIQILRFRFSSSRFENNSGRFSVFFFFLFTHPLFFSYTKIRFRFHSCSKPDHHDPSSDVRGRRRRVRVSRVADRLQWANSRCFFLRRVTPAHDFRLVFDFWFILKKKNKKNSFLCAQAKRSTVGCAPRTRTNVATTRWTWPRARSRIVAEHLTRRSCSPCAKNRNKEVRSCVCDSFVLEQSLYPRVSCRRHDNISWNARAHA